MRFIFPQLSHSRQPSRPPCISNKLRAPKLVQQHVHQCYTPLAYTLHDPKLKTRASRKTFPYRARIRISRNIIRFRRVKRLRASPTPVASQSKARIRCSFHQRMATRSAAAGDHNGHTLLYRQCLRSLRVSEVSRFLRLSFGIFWARQWLARLGQRPMRAKYI